MAETEVAPATTTTEAATTEVTGTLLSRADQPIVSEGESVLDTAGAEEKAAREAEEKRLLETKTEDLTPEEQATKASLLKAKAEADTKVAEEARAKGVPEKYDLKAPEGFILDEATIAEHTPFFKEQGYTNVQAQNAVDYEAKLQQKRVAEAEAQLKAWNESNIKETMATLGANAKTELAYVAKVKNLYSPETIEALNASGIGNLKCFILDSAKIGRMFSEEHLVNDKATRRPPSEKFSSDAVAEQFYPTMTQK